MLSQLAPDGYKNQNALSVYEHSSNSHNGTIRDVRNRLGSSSEHFAQHLIWKKWNLGEGTLRGAEGPYSVRALRLNLLGHVLTKRALDTILEIGQKTLKTLRHPREAQIVQNPG